MAMTEGGWMAVVLEAVQPVMGEAVGAEAEGAVGDFGLPMPKTGCWMRVHEPATVQPVPPEGDEVASWHGLQLDWHCTAADGLSHSGQEGQEAVVVVVVQGGSDETDAVAKVEGKRLE